MTHYDANELELHLLKFTEDQRYVTHTRLPTYIKLMELMAEATSEQTPRGIGYYKPLGWFVLEKSEKGPHLVWSEKGGSA